MRSTDLAEEAAHIERLYSSYTDDDFPQTAYMRHCLLKALKPYIRGVGLELGCSDGMLTQALAALSTSLDVVDGAASSIAAARNRNLSNVTLHEALFEEFTPTRRYDYVMATYVLEHVLDPKVAFDVARRALSPGGLLLVVVPNARALSRQLARHMGLVGDLYALTPNDLAHGHRRTYDRQSLNSQIRQHGFDLVAEGGLMLKLLADFQLNRLYEDKILGSAHVDGLYRLGLEYPDFCGSLFAVAAPDASL